MRVAIDNRLQLGEMPVNDGLFAVFGAASRVVRTGVAALEAENGDLRDRLAEAAERTRALADRVRFVRQQAALDEEPA